MALVLILVPLGRSQPTACPTARLRHCAAQRSAAGGAVTPLTLYPLKMSVAT
jgi:hypothetical protein